MAAGTEVTIPRPEIKSMRSAGLSMMPEGLEEGLKPQDLADLLEYISR
jgi:putative heme-binding domain-containing protein